MTGASSSPPTGQALAVGLVCHATLGGSSRTTSRLAGALATLGHAVHLITPGGLPWTLSTEVTSHTSVQDPSADVGVFDPLWPPSRCTAFQSVVADVARKHTLDIVHFHYLEPFAQVVVQALHGVPNPPAVVATAHGTDLPTRSLSNGTAAALRTVAAITTVSQHMARRWSAATDLTAPEVIPNFIEDDWGAAARTPPPGRPVVLHASNYRPVKRTELLAPIFRRLRQEVDAELWLAGDGPEHTATCNQLAEEIADGTVRVVGRQATIEPLLASAQLLLLTSREESFSIASLEALASGVPVVAPAVGGIPELITSGIEGALFDPASIAEPAGAMAHLLGAPQRWEAASAAARARAVQYRESAIVPRYIELYRKALANA